MNILVNCVGYVGDILFASSLAQKLKEKYHGCHITYYIPLPQPLLLLQVHPYIDRVLLDPPLSEHFDLTVNIPVVDQRYPATTQMQAAAGIEDQSLAFDTWTVFEYDIEAETRYKSLTRPIIAVQVDWSWKAYQCTPETLAQGIGAPHRDMDSMIAELRLRTPWTILEFGYTRQYASAHPETKDPVIFAKVASLIKHADWFLGSEGGLSNLACSVETKCIITTDFIEQNYGKNGRIRPCDPPLMGPAVYYPEAGHVHLDPCIRDRDIAQTIINIIENDD